MAANPLTGRVRLSFSALNAFHTCERKFQLERLLVGEMAKEDYPSTVLGHSFGKGVATYLLTRDKYQSLYQGWMAYWPIIEEAKRNQTIAANLLECSFPYLDNILEDWEVAVFRNKPAVELSFCLNINETFYYVGYIDVILRNKWTGMYAVLENKTTALNIFDLAPMYANSGQALGYSIVLDTIAGEEKADYGVYYFVGQLGAGNGYQPTIHPLLFNKTLSDRYNWFISLLMDVQRLEEMLEINVFPMRGHNCLQYMRPCRQFSTCQLHALDQYKVAAVDEIQYDFTYDLDKVISNHIERM